MKGSTAIAKILKVEGIPFVTGYPGGGPNSIVAQTINESKAQGIRTILPRTERGGVNIADGYARVSGKVGVVALYEGPGVENAFAGVAQANSDGSPLLVLGGQTTRLNLGMNNPNNDVDAPYIFYRSVKWVERVNLARQIPTFLRRAFTYMRTGRPGPVYLDMVFDIAAEQFDDALFDYNEPVKGWKSCGDPRDVEVAVRAFLGAKNPIIYAGEGVLYAEASDELLEFAELVQAPVMTTLKAKGAIPEGHPLSIGGGGATGHDLWRHFVGKADLVFAIGASLSVGPGARFVKGLKIIQSTVSELPINKDYRVTHAIMGDAKLVLRQMIDEAKKQLGGQGRRPNEALTAEIASVKEAWLKKWMPLLTSNETPINPYRAVWDICNALDHRTTIMTHDAGWPRDQIAPFWETPVPRGYLGWGHHSTLGFSVSALIGAKLAEPNKISAGWIGDGALGENGIDFETAVRNRIPILVLISNNSGLGHYVKDTPDHYEYYGDYAKVAEGLGGYGERVEKPDEIIPAINRAKKAMAKGQAALLDIITVSEYKMQYRKPATGAGEE
jgi:thiamine pyrophosphate-dependent acetolactate synthase large subunit-like protein